MDVNHQTYLVFVYGTLRRHEHNHILLMDAVSVSYQAKTRGVLVDTGWGYPALAAGSEWVFGEVYAVNDDQLARLDRLEGYRGAGANNHYERIRQVVMTDAGEVDAYVYIYTNEIAVGLPRVAHGDWKVARHWKDELLNLLNNNPK